MKIVHTKAGTEVHGSPTEIAAYMKSMTVSHNGDVTIESLTPASFPSPPVRVGAQVPERTAQAIPAKADLDGMVMSEVAKHAVNALALGRLVEGATPIGKLAAAKKCLQLFTGGTKTLSGHYAWNGATGDDATECKVAWGTALRLGWVNYISALDVYDLTDAGVKAKTAMRVDDIVSKSKRRRKSRAVPSIRVVGEVRDAIRSIIMDMVAKTRETLRVVRRDDILHEVKSKLDMRIGEVVFSGIVDVMVADGVVQRVGALRFAHPDVKRHVLAWSFDIPKERAEKHTAAILRVYKEHATSALSTSFLKAEFKASWVHDAIHTGALDEMEDICMLTEYGAMLLKETHLADETPKRRTKK